MDEDEIDAVFEATDFKTIKDLALSSPDFVGRLKAVKTTTIDRLSVGSFIETTNTFSAESSENIEEAFKEAFRTAGDFDKQRTIIDKHSQSDPLFMPLWANKDAMYASFMVGYQKAIQVNALIMQVNVVMADALIASYGGGALSPEEVKQLGTAARKIREVADMLEGLEKLGKQNKKEVANESQ